MAGGSATPHQQPIGMASRPSRPDLRGLRNLTFFRLANGRIVEDDPMMTPDLMQTLGIQAPPQPGR
jgi:hypothetical protein